MADRIRNKKEAPLFVSFDGRIMTPRPFRDAVRLTAEGEKVWVYLKGERIGVLRIGRSFTNDEEARRFDESEPYGTIHRNESEHTYYLHIPDHLMNEGAPL